jgi:tetratricopeptide (TPR) repeat protein
MTAEPTTDALIPAAQALSAGTPARPLPACPLCGAQLLVLSEQCQSCGGGLLPLLRVAELADAYFNRAVTAARDKKWWLAAEHLAVTLALRPDDVDALMLLGKIRWRQRMRELAVAALQEALRLAPHRADIKSVIDLVKRKNHRRR